MRSSLMANPPSPSLIEELQRLLGPKGYSADPADLEPWLTDWRRRYRGKAAAMLSPASIEEVAGIVRLCAEARVPLVPQGGNTSMVAGAIPGPAGDALLLSMRRMNRIRSLSAESGQAVCEAGLVLAALHERAASAGMRFPLSLGARGSATIGGLISTNAGGTQVLRFGTMRGLVLGLEAVLPDGSVFDGLAALRKDNRGYDLRQLLIGAEGTLGVVTAATLRLVPAIGSRAVAWIGLASPGRALDLLRLLEARTGESVESFELVPEAALELVLAHVPGTRAPLESAHAWNVLVEAVAPAGAPAPDAALAEVLQAALERELIDDAVIASSEAQAESFWRLRDSISEGEQKDGPAAKHDISVQVADMPRFMTEATASVEERFPGTRVIAFGHLGDGNVHFNVRAPKKAGPEWLEGEAPALTAFVHDLVVAQGGSISAEHGIGQMRLAELARLGDPARLNAMRAIKKALDPHGIMNPGKLVPPLEPGEETLAEGAIGP
jgi:FAD/FMN-containing dehydrogenase